MTDLLIKNAFVINSASTLHTDLLIRNGKIDRIEENISTEANVLDAKGMYLIPGGIDPHVHMHLPTGAGYSSDDFDTGSRAALLGGTTCLIDFVTPNKGQSLPDALADRKREAEKAYTDYSFHVSPIDYHANTHSEIKQIKQAGVQSFKVYMAYAIGLNDADLLHVLQAVADAGGLLTVHAELGDQIDQNRDRLVAEGNVSPKYHPISRPNQTEALAVKRVIELARQAGCSLYVVHVSTKESLEYIQKAQSEGQRVYAETCPHYLLLDDSYYEGDFEQTAPFVMSPPLRSLADNQALWHAIESGVVHTVGTDHCPFWMKQKRQGLDDFRKIPNGIGGVEHRMALLYTYGVLKKRISLQQWVDITATKPATIFGLYPQKGTIALGSDADLVIWNPDYTERITAKMNHQQCDSNVYEGMAIQGRAEHVVRRGEIVVQYGKWQKPTNGLFVKR